MRETNHPIKLSILQAQKEFKLKEDDNGFIISGVTRDKKWDDLVIPQFIDDKPVHTIGDSAFSEHNIKNIHFPDTIRHIGEYACHDCIIEGTLVIPEGVISIGPKAFGRTNINSVRLPDSLQIIGSNAFEMNANLTKITIPKGVIKIEGSLFGFCYALKSVTVDRNNKVYDSREGCNAIIETSTNTLVCGCLATKVHKDIRILGKECFFNVPLSSINIPEGVLEIEDSALSCDEYEVFGKKTAYQLNSVKLPSTLKKIGRYAFSGQGKLKKIEIPSGVSVIEDSSFAYTGLQSLVISEGVKVLGDYAFAGCEKLKRAVIPASVTSFGKNLFAYSAMKSNGAIIEVKPKSEALKFAKQKKLTIVEV